MNNSIDQINWSREERIAVPDPEREGRMAIRKTDWARMRRNLQSLQKPKRTLSIWYSICFGVTITAGFSIVPISTTKDLAAWVAPLYVCVTVGSFLLGALLVWLDRGLSAQNQSQINEVITDMSEIEDSFIKYSSKDAT